jgi:hypothetical protein
MISENKEPQVPAQAENPAARRVYHAPKLRRLGSVRELTLGTGKGNADGNRTGNGKGM